MLLWSVFHSFDTLTAASANLLSAISLTNSFLYRIVCEDMLPLIEDEVNHFYKELNLAEPAVRNPFVHRLDLSWMKKVEVLLCLLLLFPIRLFTALVVFLFLTFWCWLATLGWDPGDIRKPMSGWRRAMASFLPNLCRALLFSMGFHRLIVRGKQAPASEAPVVVIAPHSSFLDVLIPCVLRPCPSGISRIDNLKDPLLGGLFKAIECIGVSRDNPKSRKEALEEMKYRAVITRGQWPHICVFAEGTCTNRKCLISFKGGAFIPGSPIQPLCVKFPKIPDIYSWTWDGPGGLLLFCLTMCQLNNEVELEWLPVWKPSAEEIENPALYAEHVRQEMGRSLGVPLTEHSYEDTVLMVEGRKCGLPTTACIIEFKAVAKRLGMNLDHVKDQVAGFALMDSNKDGFVTLQEFANYHRLPLSTPVKQLFSVYDRERRGQIDFRQYLVGSACLAAVASRKNVTSIALKTLQELSSSCKTERSSVLDQQILSSILRNVEDMFADNHNVVRSRNEELKEFVPCHPEYSVLLCSLRS